MMRKHQSSAGTQRRHYPRKVYRLPAASAANMKNRHYRKPLWRGIEQHASYMEIAAADRDAERKRQDRNNRATARAAQRLPSVRDPKWHARVDASGRLPPILGTSDSGTPIFAFLGGGRLGTRSSQRAAIHFYREFINQHFGNNICDRDASPAAIYRVCCNKPPDLGFEWVSAAWDFPCARSNLIRKLKLGLGPKPVQNVYDTHGRDINVIEIQWIQGVPPILARKHQVYDDSEEDDVKAQDSGALKNNGEVEFSRGNNDEDVFDLMERLEQHMKRVAVDALNHFKKREHLAAIKIQSRYRIRHGQMLAHMRRCAKAEEEAERKKLDMAARRIQAAWRRRMGQFAAHLKRQAIAEAKLEAKRERAAAHKISLWWSRVSGSFARKMKARAEAQMRQEEADMNRAALKIQSAWRRKQGSLALHMKRQARREKLKHEKLENESARRLQIWWSRINGSYAAKLKARAEMELFKEQQDMNRAALKIQSAWRRKQGSLALHMKRQAQREKLKHEKLENESARRLQIWWSRINGSYAAKLKARAEMQLFKEDQARDAAARRLQIWWSRINGSYAAKLKARAEMELMKEEKAAIRVQIWWSRMNGSYAAKLKARAEIQLYREEEARNQAALRIQHWFQIQSGTYVAKMRAKAEIQLMNEEAEMNRAALKIQAAWRRRQGTFAVHLRRQAKKAAKAAEYWTILWDAAEGCPYFFDHSTNESSWECPEKVWESGRHSEDWFVCYDSRTQIEYFLHLTDFSVHPIDEQSQYMFQQGDYYNPPPLAKVALKQEHEPVAAWYPMPIEKGPENGVAARVRRRKARAKLHANKAKEHTREKPETDESANESMLEDLKSTRKKHKKDQKAKKDKNSKREKKKKKKQKKHRRGKKHKKDRSY